MRRERFDVRLEVAAHSEDGTFSGYASVFDHAMHGGDIIRAGAFASSIAAHAEARTMPAMLWQHDTDEPVGVWEQMAEDDHGLVMSGRLVLDVQRAREAYALLKAGAVNGLSIGYIVTDEAMIDGAREIKEVDLWETSIVTFPRNDAARILSVNTYDGELPPPKIIERSLRDAGLSRTQAKTLLARGYPGLAERDAREDSEILTQAQRLLDILRTTK